MDFSALITSQWYSFDTDNLCKCISTVQVQANISFFKSLLKAAVESLGEDRLRKGKIGSCDFEYSLKQQSHP